MKSLRFQRPPVGKVSGYHVEGSGVGYIDWQPGNGVRYTVIATELSDEVAEREGGRVLVTLGPCEMVSYILNPGDASILEMHYVKEKFRSILSEQDLYMVTALLNWVLLGVDGCQYASLIWNEAREKFKHLDLAVA